MYVCVVDIGVLLTGGGVGVGGVGVASGGGVVVVILMMIDPQLISSWLWMPMVRHMRIVCIRLPLVCNCRYRSVPQPTVPSDTMQARGVQVPWRGACPPARQCTIM